jgi:hypothetical protein
MPRWASLRTACGSVSVVMAGCGTIAFALITLALALEIIAWILR